MEALIFTGSTVSLNSEIPSFPLPLLTPKKLSMIGIITTVVLVAIALVVVGIAIFNRFVSNRNRVKDAWSNIDVALKQRHDLVPNLVNTVKGYATHEQETLQQVIEARNSAVAVPTGHVNEQIQAEGALQQTLGRLFALSESYPDLKANQNFMQLQQKLSDLEADLERRRRYYNGTVRENNTYGESFPAVIFSGLFGYERFDFFEAAEYERENVVVDFS